jgi:bacterioferritin-associated ferredoxin
MLPGTWLSERSMIVCVCNGLRERDCREAARSGQCRGVGCMYRVQGCRVRCGRCVPLMQEILDAHAPAQPVSCGGGCGGERALLAPAAPER